MATAPPRHKLDLDLVPGLRAAAADYLQTRVLAPDALVKSIMADPTKVFSGCPVLASAAPNPHALYKAAGKLCRTHTRPVRAMDAGVHGARHHTPKATPLTCRAVSRRVGLMVSLQETGLTPFSSVKATRRRHWHPTMHFWCTQSASVP